MSFDDSRENEIAAEKSEEEIEECDLVHEGQQMLQICASFDLGANRN